MHCTARGRRAPVAIGASRGRRRWVVRPRMARPTQMIHLPSNKPAEANPAIALLLQAKRQWRGVADTERSALEVSNGRMA